MKKIVLIILSTTFPLIVLSQPCLPEGITFTTQAQIDSFQINNPNCTEIEGNVHILGDDITSFGSLNILTAIYGDLFIGTWSVLGGNPSLLTLSGLENLTHIDGNLIVRLNDMLSSLDGLDNLSLIGGDLNITANQNLSSISILGNLLNIGGNISIGGNSILSLTGLEGIDTVKGSLSVSSGSLIDLTGLNNISLIEGNLAIGDNDLLSSLAGLENLTAIGDSLLMGGWSSFSGVVHCHDNPSLSNLLALSNLSSIGGSVHIYGTENLIDLSGLENITTINANLVIGFNTDLWGAWCPNNSLSSLNGLNNLVSIMGNLEIQANLSLTNLDALDNLETIGGSLKLGYNDSLVDISALENLVSIGESLVIGGIYDESGNDLLTSLEGLDNINAGSIENLRITNNVSLSTCHILSICEYLASPNAIVEIHDNAYGCNSPNAVQDSCEANAVSLEERCFLEDFAISPNPFISTTTLTYTLDKYSAVTINIFNPQGQLIEKIERNQPKGEQNTQWSTEGLPTGIYYYRIQAGDTFGSGKIIKMN